MKTEDYTKTLSELGKIKRNDMCPCGSAKKFKKCCSNGKRILKWDSDWLFHKTQEVPDPNEPDTRAQVEALLDEMWFVLKNTTNGLGLAANQIELDARVGIVWPHRGANSFAIINPVIMYGKNEYQTAEGSLSYPGFKVAVERHQTIHLGYWKLGEDNVFRKVFEDFHGHTAQIIEHLVDLLLGVNTMGKAWKEEQKGQADES
jgi:peptide deformylase